MKNQYFGDVRDLFKYDLIQQILEGISSLQGFTFIPMLTENDLKGGDGNKRDFDRAKKNSRPGTNNKELMKFLLKYKIDKDKRDFTEIEKYFKSSGLKVSIYEDQCNEYFNNGIRDEYFKNISANLLHKSLVFVDPDNGLQIKKETKKHLLYRDVKYLYDHMDKDSILMIYQHFPRARVKYPEYLPEGRSKKLKEKTGNLPTYISGKEIIFFLLTKNNELKSQLKRIINKYKRHYPNFFRHSF